ncbi:uncharacterized protein CTRU02_214558 [Colletotrichum truncatum]|uniref:Uncharacterized protein n=1 Tax=Colletotrichum truncatum TaxID=5467 RepID=A0ACC3YF08_COLTU|nr:uncharacterized protein CTRU02_12227 [Colletotrichum truncatum]KAF6785016.1 hypothetical protein CTRU02_12227 [Colletotrichum truncatum]
MDTESVFTSRVFKFVIGTEKREFHVQEKLIVPHSNAFTRMFSNGMKESQQGLVVLDDVEPATFSSFLSFVIYNDYNVTGSETHREQQVEADANQSLLKDCESLQDRYYPHSNRPNFIRKVPNLMYIALLVRSGDRGRCYGPPAGSPDSGLLGFDVIRDFKSANLLYGLFASY